MAFKRAGKIVNRELHKKKEFKNPDILETLINKHRLLEIGSNYPHSIFDPFMWTEDAFYDKISTKQIKMVERKKMEREGSSASSTSIRKRPPPPPTEDPNKRKRQ
eukprot:TRINITY_DN6849_c1_g1_i1.p1 TRINITY_DN6849_c1_g1~~TRINITY_DN6849_c1_g1_i1.p1  ORF type:complete len:105 (-),score=24.70 TRINITY_DN6849_c1_g1_i1:85-399(-)